MGRLGAIGGHVEASWAILEPCSADFDVVDYHHDVETDYHDDHYDDNYDDDGYDDDSDYDDAGYYHDESVGRGGGDDDDDDGEP